MSTVERLELQFVRTANGRLRIGCDKHALKHQGRIADFALIFSYPAKQNLLNFSDTLCAWIRAHYPHVKYVKDITVEMLNEYLAEKNNYISYSTLQNYASLIRTWERLLNAFFKSADIQWQDGLEIPIRLTDEEKAIMRMQTMSEDDLNMIMEYATRPGTKSLAPDAWLLSDKLGLRVEGDSRITAGDVHLDVPARWGHGFVTIIEKGGLKRSIDIQTQEDKDYISELAKNKAPDERLIPIKKGSINRQLHRVMTDLGLKEKYPETSVHSIRKKFAKRTWDMVRAKGYSKEEAVRYVNRILGHNEERNVKLLGIYVHSMD